MIRIAGSTDETQEMQNGYPEGSIEQMILQMMLESREDYDYDSAKQLRFELGFRSATIRTARELNRSGMDFAVFRKSRCNPAYWNRTSDGGFKLKKDANPSEAILDIFKNGAEYATECATAVIIVFYKAALELFTAAAFDKAFPEIQLMNWHHIDPAFRGLGVMRHEGNYLPGDRMYFINPDVNPATPEWQGENVIMLGSGSFYGHGIGIHDDVYIIRELNKNRVEGATESAYLMKKAGRPDYRKLLKIKDSNLS